MTKQEYEVISKALEECQDGITRAFDRFNENLRLSSKIIFSTKDKELVEEAQRLTQHND